MERSVYGMLSLDFSAVLWSLGKKNVLQIEIEEPLTEAWNKTPKGTLQIEKEKKKI